MRNVDKLARQLTLAAKAYYEGQPILTDEQFDGAIDQLRALDPGNPILQASGWGYKPEGKITAQHDSFVGSLPKTHNLDSLQRGSILTPKFDGLSIVVYYKNGRLEKVLTRGDGQTGVIVTGRINVPNKITDTWVRSVKGEAVITFRKFADELAVPYANPRNAAAGIINAIDSPHNHLVDFIAYGIRSTSGDGDMVMDSVWVNGVCEALQRNKFLTSPFLEINDPSEIALTTLKEWADSQPYPTDGLVNNAVEAIKFPTEDKEAKVVKINWNQSEKGRLIPVLEIEPVELYGTTVTNVTAYHAKFVKDHVLGPEAVVRVTKANEIIPYITKVISAAPGGPAFPVEMAFPNCKWDGVHLVTEDPVAIDLKGVIKFVKTLVDKDGLGDKVIKEILSVVNVKSITGLVVFLDQMRGERIRGNLDFTKPFTGKLTPHLTGLGGVMTTELLGEVDRELLLFALNLDGIGKTASRDLAPYLDQIADPPDAGVDLDSEWQKAIKQNREKAIASLQEYRPLIQSCLEVLTLTELADTKPVVLTGKMSQPRKTVVARLKQMGYREEKTVTQDSVVIAADPNGTSSKLKKARELGASIMTEQEFFA